MNERKDNEETYSTPATGKGDELGRRQFITAASAALAAITSKILETLT